MSDFDSIIRQSLDASHGRVVLTEARLQHLAKRLHALGPRCLYEFLRQQWDQPASSFAANLERFATINPDHLKASGGDAFPFPLAIVSNSNSDDGDAA